MSKADGELMIDTIRVLAADLVQAHKGGHAGTPMGAAAIGISLWRDVMKYDPTTPLWLNRDRFILSAGHACLLQYIMLHFAGYEAWPLSEVKRYHSRDFRTSRAAGHPEYEQAAGIEMTTGPLGQGLANSVGLAIAEKQMAARYNKPGFENLFDHTIWTFSGDGCIQEGIGQEAISIAGHLGLDNLVMIYDKNKITVDGTIDNCFTEDVAARFEAANWNVIEINPYDQPDGDEQISLITKSLEQAREHKGQPTIVIVATIIGFGSRKANTGPAHGQPLGDDEVSSVKNKFGFDLNENFVIPDRVYRLFAHLPERGKKIRQKWEENLSRYSKEYPEEYSELQRRVSGGLPNDWRDLLPTKEDLPQQDLPTRKSSGIVVEALAPKFVDLILGSADLLESTFVSWNGMVEFQNVRSTLLAYVLITKVPTSYVGVYQPISGLGDYSGRQIRYGIREHSMAAIANGIAAYLPYNVQSQGSGFLPIYSTFFMFTSYALPAIRMAALQKLRTISIATHDSIGIGEDGPTHQPIALASFFRALPNVKLWRPCDAEEVMAAWEDAISGHPGPRVLCLSRQPLPMQNRSNRAKALKGAYSIEGTNDASLVLVATGSEVSLAMKVKKEFENKDIETKVVSAPCLALFDEQFPSFREEVIPARKAVVVAIEAWSSFGWAKYAHASISMSTFGHSGPQADLFDFFGFGLSNVIATIEKFYKKCLNLKGELVIPGVGEFEDLLVDHMDSNH